LVGPRTVAFEKIQAQIEKGKALRNRPIGSKAELDEPEAERSKWSKYNSELLTCLFDNPTIADEYNRFCGVAFPIRPTLSQLVDEFRESMHDKIARLEAVRDHLELIQNCPVHQANRH
jgi:hypothetical protein